MPRNKFSSLALSALLLAVLAPSAWGQTGGGSSYSIFNIGDLRTGSTASALGRAGVEAGVPSTSLVNSLNPAGWTDLRLVTLQAALSFDQFQVSDASSKLYQNSSKLQEFAVALPYSPDHGGTLVFAIRPYSTVNYRTRLNRSVSSADTSVGAVIDYTGHGGISNAVVGTSYTPVSWLSIGAAANFYFGSIENESDVTFPVARLNPALYRQNSLYVGWGFQGGVHIDPTENFRIGASFDGGSNLTHDYTVSSTYTDADSIVVDTTFKSSTTFKLPARVTVGASYLLGRSMISAQGSMQNWGDEQFSTARPASRVAVGYDYLPSRSLNATGLERWTFRLGAFLENTYYKVGNGTGINQMGGTLGFRYPIGTAGNVNSSTAFDIGLEIGKRGTTEDNLTSELYGRLGIEFSIGELWFIRSRR